MSPVLARALRAYVRHSLGTLAKTQLVDRFLDEHLRTRPWRTTVRLRTGDVIQRQQSVSLASWPSGSAHGSLGPMLCAPPPPSSESTRAYPTPDPGRGQRPASDREDHSRPGTCTVPGLPRHPA